MGRKQSNDNQPLLGGNGPPNQKSVARRVSHRAAQWFGVDEGATGAKAMESPQARMANRQHGRSVWHHGVITLQAARRRMRVHGASQGMFLIRQTSVRGAESLMIACEGTVDEFVISYGKNGYAIAGGADFSSLEGLIDFHYDRPGALPCTLTIPCPQTSSRPRALVNQMNRSKRWAKGGVTNKAPPAGAVAVAVEPDNVATTSFSEPPAYTEQTSQPPQGAPGPAAAGAYADPAALRAAKLKAKKDSLPTFRPYFIMLITLAQLIVCGYEVGVGGYLPVKLKPEEQTLQVPVGMEGTLQTMSRLEEFNIFVGPSTDFLIKHGAKFGPCMRKDTAIFAQRAAGIANESTWGCCSKPDTAGGDDLCGFTPETECPTADGYTWASNAPCPKTTCNPVLRPCCLGHGERCEVRTREHCEFDRGFWDETATECSEVYCLETCGLKINAETPNQWYRLILPLFLHAGAVHGVLVIGLQYKLGAPIERACGFLRMMIIWLVAGVGGNLVSSIFSPNVAQVGASGAAYGLLGVQIVDMCQSWQLFERPWVRMLPMLVLTVVMLMLGTLPWIDNWAHIGGFVFGVVGAIVFLPYLTFGKWDKVRKRCLLAVCFPLLICMFLFGFLMFYEFQASNFCPKCDYIQCIPWTATLCDDPQYA